MEPMEWAVMGLVFVAGALVGSWGKGLVKSSAKGMMAARDTVGGVREGWRETLEEVRAEREQERAAREPEGELAGTGEAR